MKEEDVLKSLPAGTYLSGSNFGFQVEQFIYKRKSDGMYVHQKSGVNLAEASVGNLCHGSY